MTWPDDADAPSPARAAIGDAVRTRLSRNPMVSQVKTPKADMFLRHGFLSPQECEEMKRRIDTDAVPSQLFSGTGNALYRTSSSCNFSAYDPFIARLTQRIDTLLGYDGTCGETLQGQRYEPGQEYKLHCDHFPGIAHYWPAMRETGGQRCWTAMAYLCDVDAGGETMFPRLDVMIPPRRGTLLIWNNMGPNGQPNGETVHAARPVERGVKYVLTKWYRERPWLPTTPA